MAPIVPWAARPLMNPLRFAAVFVLSGLAAAVFGQETPAGPAAEPPQARQGKVALEGRALRDDGGVFNGLGVSYFQALRRVKTDRERFLSDVRFLASCGFQYMRVLTMVGHHRVWKDREIAPAAFKNREGEIVEAWPDYWEQLAAMIDLAYEAGLRTQLTVFADAQGIMPDKAARREHLRRVIEVTKGREHKVILIEIGNEAWQNGFPGKEGIAELRALGRQAKEQTDILIALSAPDGQTNEALLELYEGSGADIATEHFSRDIRAEGGWQPVRDVFRVNSAPALPPVSSNEPIGPGASVASENDPLRLACAGAYAWMSGLPMYVFHCHAGVTGEDAFEDTPGLRTASQPLRLLPGGIGNWPRGEGKENTAPFTLFAHGVPDAWRTDAPQARSGVIRLLFCAKDNDFYALPVGLGPEGAVLEARRAMDVEVLHPLTGARLTRIALRGGERLTLPPDPPACLIRGKWVR